MLATRSSAPLRSFLCALLVAVCAAGGARADVIISEFVASNQTGLVDEDGEQVDWIELFNDGTTPVNLGGWRLTDDSLDPVKWAFPAIPLEPKGFLLVFASGKDRRAATAPLHTNFKLSSNGGYLALFRNDGSPAYSYPNYPAQYDDKPYGVQQTVTTTAYISPTASLQYYASSSTPPPANWTTATGTLPGWSSGTNGVGYVATAPGWLFKTYFGTGFLGSLAAANALINTPSQQNAFFQGTMPVINYLDTATDGHYTPNATPAWLGGGVDHDNYAVEATGIITIPAAGTYTFGVSSDDGFELKVRPVGSAVPWTSIGAFAQFDGGRAAADTLGAFSFPAAGDYEIRCMIFEGGGGSEGEFFSTTTPGNPKSAWDSTFKLIGDTANGGLAIRSVPAGTTANPLVPFIGSNSQPVMKGISPSLFIRYLFNVPTAAAVQTLSMPVRYNDGFVVYLNGTEVGRRNAPAGGLTNDSTALSSRSTALAAYQDTIDLTPYKGALLNGTNVLAVQALNYTPNDGEFLFQTELASYTPTTGATSYFLTTTPAKFNTGTVYNKVAPVTASLPRGFYTSAQTVTLACGTPGATIRYTFDGTAPTLSSNTSATYSGPISITKTTTMRYAAFLSGYDPSAVGTQTYIFLSDVITQANQQAPVIQNPSGAIQTTTTWPTGPVNGQTLDYGMDPTVVNNPNYSGTIVNDLKSIPTFSIVTDQRYLFDPNYGIYVNPGNDGDSADPNYPAPLNPPQNWERAASIELINPDGTTGFQINGGIRIRGGYSRSGSNPKHGFRLFFRDDYGGGQLKYPLFGTTGQVANIFNKFDLRTSANYSWSFEGNPSCTFVQDPWVRDTQIAMGSPSSHGKFYHLYLNGRYWGLYNIDERPEANFAATYFGGTADEYDTIKVAPETGYAIFATDGTTVAWRNLWTLADTGMGSAKGDAVNNSTYQQMLGNNPDGTRNSNYPVLLDPVNTIDYNLGIYYGGNLDAAISNFLSNQKPNNWFGVRSRLGTSGGFKFIQHDSEHTLLNLNEDRTGPWPAGNSATQGVEPAFAASSPQYLFQQCVYSPDFRAIFADRVYKHFANGGVLTPASAVARFNARIAEIDRAVVGESARWGDAKATPALTRDNFLSAAANQRTSYFPTRTAVVLAQFRAKGWYPNIDPPLFNQRGGSVNAGFNVTLTLASGSSGTIYYTTDGSDPRALGGSLSPAAVPYSGPISINVSKTIRTRLRNGSVWSAIDEATFYTVQNYTGLVISELHYNPLPEGLTSGDEYEFVELKNTGATTLDLGGLSFNGGLTYNFPTGATLAPGKFWVLVRNQAAFSARYPGVTVSGVYTGKLDNSGENLTLVHALGATILSFNYKDAPPWPAAADGQGFSLVLKSPSLDPDDGSSWRASAAVGGSPGADDPDPAIPAILVSEALSASVSPQTDAIELYNPGAAAVDIGNWWLTDDHNTPKKFHIAAGTSIPAGGFLTFTEAQFASGSPGGIPFSLSANGEEVYLFSADGAGALTGYAHGYVFAAGEDNVTFGRYVNSIGKESFPRQIARTFGAANSGPLIGPVILNEIQYAPPAGLDEYVELKNISGATVPLYDPANPANPWRISGLGYNFPANASMPPGSLALIVPISPATFRTKYNIPAAVQIFGPFDGALDNGGERLSLEKPAPPVVGPPPTVPYIVVDTVHYNNVAPWPVGAAGGDGPSLQRVSATSYADDPASWFASGVTPGVENALNQPPSVSFASPANNAVFTLPANIPLQAAATDSDGTIQRVEFFDGSTKIGETLASPFIFNWASASPGVHTLTAKATDNGFAISTSAPLTVRVNPPALGGNGTGLRGDYFKDVSAHLTGAPTGTRVDPVINFSVNSGWPGTYFSSLGTTTYSVRWTGQVIPRLTQTYTFKTVSDDGVRLWVNNVLIIDNWTDHGDSINYGYIDLTAGRLYDVKLEFYQGGGGATISLAWSAVSGGLQEEIIPAAQMYPNGAPIIITGPQSQTVERGTPVAFSVLASGQNLSYQWLKNNADLPGATNQTLVLPDVLSGDAASYSVRVSNASGSPTSAAATLNVIFTDADGDGIQDSWLQRYFGHPTGQAGDLSRPGDDADGDGRTNLEEFLAGTDPRNGGDRLSARVLKNPDAAGVIVVFTAQSQRSYSLRFTDTLNGATNWTKLQDVPAAPGARSISIPDASSGSRFYQIITPAQ